MTRSVLRFLPLLSLLAAACSAQTDDAESSEAELGAVQQYFSDATKLDLSDLTRTTVGFASEGLNSQLSASAGPVRAGIRFERPMVFAERAEPSRVLPDSAQVKSLDAIAAGLSANFGETELATQVNKARLEHLKSTADDYFVESGFALNGGLSAGHGWSFDAGGLGVAVGFNADAVLSSRVIVATKDDRLNDVVSAPLAAVREMRGFIYPRSLDEVRSMKPGEMFALRGMGRLGANFGIGAPIFIADPFGPVGYRIVVSAGVAGIVAGQIDVQLVRLGGDEVVVDLGVENGKGVSFHAGINDEWGIKGICDDGQKCLRAVEMGGKQFDLSRIVEKAIEKQVNKYLSFRIGGDVGTASSRISLSRFRMHLDRGNPEETSRALEQLLKFDLRLAQALYNRDLGAANPAVTADFDAVRASTTSTRNFGFEILGMNIYHRNVVEKQGTFVVQTPEGAKSFLFDHLQKNSGWFQTTHAFSRTGVAAESVDRSSPSSFSSNANLFVQTVSANKHMTSDFAIDNADAMLLGLGQKAVVDVLDEYGNELEQTLWAKCPTVRTQENDTPTWDETCNLRLLEDPAFTSIRDQGLAAVEAKIGGLPDDLKSVVRGAASLRLRLQSVGIHNHSGAGGAPKVAVSSDIRLDDRALEMLTSKSKDEYARALEAYLVATSTDRREIKNAGDKERLGRELIDDEKRAIEKMASVFEAKARAYAAVAQQERDLPRVLAGKRFVNHPLGIRFTVSDDERATLESAIVRSTAHERALAATSLFDGLREAADSLDQDLHDEHAALYPLIGLVPPAHLDVGFKVDAELQGSSENRRFKTIDLKSEAFTARGKNVALLGAGMFDIRAVVAAAP